MENEDSLFLWSLLFFRGDLSNKNRMRKEKNLWAVKYGLVIYYHHSWLSTFRPWERFDSDGEKQDETTLWLGKLCSSFEKLLYLKSFWFIEIFTILSRLQFSIVLKHLPVFKYQKGRSRARTHTTICFTESASNLLYRQSALSNILHRQSAIPTFCFAKVPALQRES